MLSVLLRKLWPLFLFVCLFLTFIFLFFQVSGEVNPWHQRKLILRIPAVRLPGRRGRHGPQGPLHQRGAGSFFRWDGLCVSLTYFSTRIFPLFLFSILFVRVSDFIYNCFSARALCPRGDTHGQWLFVAALVSISNGRHWKPLSYLVCFRIPKGHFQINFIFPSFLIPIFFKGKDKKT